jgi:hypothetical protein
VPDRGKDSRTCSPPSRSQETASASIAMLINGTGRRLRCHTWCGSLDADSEVRVWSAALLTPTPGWLLLPHVAQKKPSTKPVSRRAAVRTQASTKAANAAGTEAAILVAFEIHHFKLFHHARLDLHPETTVLVGLNDVGKSVLLEAIYLYGQIQLAGFRGPLSDKSFGGANGEPTQFIAEWDVAGQRWRHSIKLDTTTPEERLERGSEFWSWNPKTRVLETHRGQFDARELERYTTLARVDPPRWKLDTDVEESIHEPLKVAGSFATPNAYLFEPSALGASTPLDLQQPRRNGYGWAIWLQEIVNRRNDDLKDMEAAVRRLFPFFRRVRVQEERLRIEREISELGFAEDGQRARLRGVPEMAAVSDKVLEMVQRQASKREVFVEIFSAPEAEAGGQAAHPKSEPLSVVAADISAGLLLAITHFSLVYADEAGRLILLEEPENGLNAKINLHMMREFLSLVRRRNRQLILTTHNEWWLDLVPPESIRVVTRDAQGAHIHQPDPAHLRVLRKDLGVYPSEIMSAHGPEGLLVKESASKERYS